MFKSKDKEKFLHGVLLAYLVLVLHVLLIVAMGLLVIFFRGVINYMGWILLGFFVAIVGSACFFYIRMKHEKKTFKQMLNSSIFNGRSVEVSVLGGLATLKLGRPAKKISVESDDSFGKMIGVEGKSKINPDELLDMMCLFEKGLITHEEFNIVKDRLFKKDIAS